jgi:hypothetical protein
MSQSEKNNFYVYVYIDPRNYEEFYYGKGQGGRRDTHLNEARKIKESDGKVDQERSKKIARIIDILNSGLEPIIKNIAANLSEDQAFLIETTLIWKLGKFSTNKIEGNFGSLFRPHDTMHRNLPGFDFSNGIYYFNVGEGKHRNWDDCRSFGFLSAGQGEQWSDQIDLDKGDIVVAYLKGKGYVGVGRERCAKKKYMDFRIDGKLLHEHPGIVQPNISHNSSCEKKSEYILPVDWIKSVSRSDSYWEKNNHLFTSQLVRASLKKQTFTCKFIEEKFQIRLDDELKQSPTNEVGTDA